MCVWGGGLIDGEDGENLLRAQGGLVVHHISLVLVVSLKRVEKDASIGSRLAAGRAGGQSGLWHW